MCKLKAEYTLSCIRGYTKRKTHNGVEACLESVQAFLPRLNGVHPYDAPGGYRDRATCVLLQYYMSRE